MDVPCMQCFFFICLRECENEFARIQGVIYAKSWSWFYAWTCSSMWKLFISRHQNQCEVLVRLDVIVF